MLNYDFLKVLFSDLNSGFIEFRAFHYSTKQPFQQFCQSIEEINIEQLSKDHDVYFGVCPRSTNIGDKKSVKQVRCLWTDLDGHDFVGGKEEALAKLHNFPIKPTIVIDSGNGYHVYWLLREYISINCDQDISRVEAYLKALTVALEGDLSSSEIARILRVPGTLNHKNIESPKTVSVIEFNPTQECNLNDFDSILTINEQSSNHKVNSLGWIAQALSSISEEEHNRNTTFTKIIGRFHNDGLTSSDIYAMLEPHALKHSYDLDELKQQIDGICQRYPKEQVVIPSEFQSSPLLLSEFLKKDIPPVEYFVTDFVQKKGKAMISAAPNVGKSIFVQNIALDIAIGRPFLYE